MNERIRAISIVMLGIVCCTALVVAGIVTAQGKDIPPILAGAVGAAIGAIAAITPALGSKE